MQPDKFTHDQWATDDGGSDNDEKKKDPEPQIPDTKIV